MPEQLIIREATAKGADDIAHVHVERRGEPPMQASCRLKSYASHSYQRRQDYWRSTLAVSHELVLVAALDGRIVGFAAGGPERSGDPQFSGELYALYVLADAGPGNWRSTPGAGAETTTSAGMAQRLVWVSAGTTPLDTSTPSLEPVSPAPADSDGDGAGQRSCLSGRGLRDLMAPGPGPTTPC